MEPLEIIKQEMEYYHQLDLSGIEPTKREYKSVLNPDVRAGEQQRITTKYLNFLTTIGYWVKEPTNTFLGYKYVAQVLTGVIPTNQNIYDNCKKFIWMLENQGTEDFPYFWDEEAANDFIYAVQHVFKDVDMNGDLVNLVMQPNQHFRYGQLFGWVDKDGKRVVNYMFTVEGRGGGKTVIMIMVALYMLIEDFKKKNVTAAFNAANRDDTLLLFQRAVSVYENSSPKVMEYLEAISDRIRRDPRIFKGDQSWFRAIPGAIHGLALNLVVGDEIHMFEQRHLTALQALVRSQSKVKESLMILGSTRSDGYSDVMEEFVQEGMERMEYYKTRASAATKLDYFYQIEDWEDVKSLRNWVIAQPNLMFKNLNRIVEDYHEAIKDPSSQKAREMWTQDFNFIDTSEKERYVSDHVVRKNNKEIDRETMRGKDAYIGVDLGGLGDFTAVYVVVPDVIEGKETIYTEGKSFINEIEYKDKTTTKRKHWKDLEYWHDELDIVRKMPRFKENGVEIDTYIQELMEFFNVVKIAYDPHDSTEFVTRSGYHGYGNLLYLVKQRAEFMHEGLDKLRKLYEQHTVISNNDPLLKFYAMNARVREQAGKISIAKPGNGTKGRNGYEQKIDGLVAVSIALTSFLDEGGFVDLEMAPAVAFDFKDYIKNQKSLHSGLYGGR